LKKSYSFIAKELNNSATGGDSALKLEKNTINKQEKKRSLIIPPCRGPFLKYLAVTMITTIILFMLVITVRAYKPVPNTEKKTNQEISIKIKRDTTLEKGTCNISVQACVIPNKTLEKGTCTMPVPARVILNTTVNIVSYSIQVPASVIKPEEAARRRLDVMMNVKKVLIPSSR